jgi:hypothetical protein
MGEYLGFNFRIGTLPYGLYGLGVSVNRTFLGEGVMSVSAARFFWYVGDGGGVVNVTPGGGFAIGRGVRGEKVRTGTSVFRNFVCTDVDFASGVTL